MKAWTRAPAAKSGEEKPDSRDIYEEGLVSERLDVWYVGDIGSQG